MATSEAFGDLPGARLFPGEEQAVRSAAEERRREFTTTRYHARLAMASLGVAPVTVLSGAAREPLWPDGIVGSLTHCRGYRAAALARAEDLLSIGVDAEPHAPLPDGLLAAIATRAELSRLCLLGRELPGLNWDRMTFSAKESVYKAWFPLARSRLGFKEADLHFAPNSDVFTATLSRSVPLADGRRVAFSSGRWTVVNGLILTAVTVSPRSPATPPHSLRC